MSLFFLFMNNYEVNEGSNSLNKEMLFINMDGTRLFVGRDT